MISVDRCTTGGLCGDLAVRRAHLVVTVANVAVGLERGRRSVALVELRAALAGSRCWHCNFLLCEDSHLEVLRRSWLVFSIVWRYSDVCGHDHFFLTVKFAPALIFTLSRSIMLGGRGQTIRPSGNHFLYL